MTLYHHSLVNQLLHIQNSILCAFSVDTPDPYLKMQIPTSAEIVKRTKCVSNNKNPEWHEEPFVFHIDPEENNVLGLLK